MLAAGCLIFALVYLPGARGARSSSSEGPRPELEEPESSSVAQEQGPSGGSSEFLHTNPNHARLPCLLCHKRDDNSPRPRLPGHVPCSGCHVPEFQSTQAPLCTICHEGTAGGSLKAFPPLRNFQMRFDHALHTRGAAAAGCATCHRPARGGVAQSIPRSAGAHATCFQCHTARAQGPSGHDISSCSTCHQVGALRRTPETAAAFRVGFSHATHARRGLTCTSCHTVRAGEAQGRQVASPRPLMHHATARAQSCATCHNDRRAFGIEDFTNCVRCHKGKSYGF
ncbi:MAG TPA: cytochrome c3 family protein [Pyrinomonadaceae bacterium]|nr:cytochrome c3 family protein [Pyrinomonadaceae bacterium]